MQQVYITDETWTQTFHLQLPNMTVVQPLRQACAGNDTACFRTCGEECRQLAGLYAAVTSLTATMRQSISHFVRRVYQVIPDINIAVTEFKPENAANARH
jgi:hypothetical protein